MGANLTLARFLKKTGCRCRPTRDGSVSIWHMIDWFSTACCLYGARVKSEGRPCGAVIWECGSPAADRSSSHIVHRTSRVGGPSNSNTGSPCPPPPLSLSSRRAERNCLGLGYALRALALATRSRYSLLAASWGCWSAVDRASAGSEYLNAHEVYSARARELGGPYSNRTLLACFPHCVRWIFLGF
jgi:hypothetical protein